MRLKNLRLKHKVIKLRRFLQIGGGKPRKLRENGKRAPWMMPVSHGYHIMETDKPASEFEPVVVQREQVEETELWFFGVFDDGVGEGITKHMQSNFFDKMPKETRMRKKCREALMKAHVNARLRSGNEDEPVREMGSAAAMVINGEILVMANMGDYKAVICRDGEAYQIAGRKQQPPARSWSMKLISGLLPVPKRENESSELVVGFERVDSETEFVILASNGVWEVMKQQEAVNLVRHIENPQAAAECLATEALVRMSRSNISCLVIRFE